jgi:hypothetical protein
MQCPVLPVWFSRLGLLLLLATGCGVQGSGLGGGTDAGTKAPTLDGHPPTEVTPAGPEAAPGSEVGHDSVPAWADVQSAAETPPVEVDGGADALLPFLDTSPQVDLPAAAETPTADTRPDLPSSVPDVPLADLPAAEVIVAEAGPSEANPPEVPASDLPGLDLPGLDLPGLDLPALDLPGPDLPGLDLPGPDLPKLDLSPDLRPAPSEEWTLDNTSTIGGHTPAVTGAPTVTSTPVGTSLCFDGSADGLLFSSNPIQAMRQFTIQILIDPQLSAGTKPRLLHIGDPNTPNDRMTIQLWPATGGDWYMVAGFSWNGTVTNVDTSAVAHPSGQWYWLALTYDGQAARLYVNGVLEATSANFTYGPMVAASTSVAMRQSNENFLDGCLRSMDFYASALSASQLNRP